MPNVCLMLPKSDISQCLHSYDLKSSFSLVVDNMVMMLSMWTAKIVVLVGVDRL